MDWLSRIYNSRSESVETAKTIQPPVEAPAGYVPTASIISPEEAFALAEERANNRRKELQEKYEQKKLNDLKQCEAMSKELNDFLTNDLDSRIARLPDKFENCTDFLKLYGYVAYHGTYNSSYVKKNNS
jgi:hypothetical protein